MLKFKVFPINESKNGLWLNIVPNVPTIHNCDTLQSRQCREAFAKEFDDIEAEVKVREL